MVVVLVIPFGLQASGLTAVDVTSPGPRIVHPFGLLALGVCTVAGALVMQRLGRAARERALRQCDVRHMAASMLAAVDSELAGGDGS